MVSKFGRLEITNGTVIMLIGAWFGTLGMIYAIAKLFAPVCG